MDNPTGLDLKLERMRLRLKARDIATAMGVSASRVSLIEREQFPTAESVERYRSAIVACSTTPVHVDGGVGA